MFDAEKVKNEIVQWIKDWFEINGKDCNAVVGISGGKDSTIAAALCVEALGKDRVVGVQMPNGTQSDIEVADEVIKYLEIKHYEINIGKSYRWMLHEMAKNNIKITNQTMINLPARLRMSVLYAVAQSYNGRVVNTCNLSEEWVGYSTRWGDNVGDFSPLGNLTVSEVKAIGHALGIPDIFIEKPPADGLTGKTDEEVLGITYEEIDNHIRNNCFNEKVNLLYQKNCFKKESLNIPTFKGGN